MQTRPEDGTGLGDVNETARLEQKMGLDNKLEYGMELDQTLLIRLGDGRGQGTK